MPSYINLNFKIPDKLLLHYILKLYNNYIFCNIIIVNVIILY